MSMKLIPAAATLTRTCPDPGGGNVAVLHGEDVGATAPGDDESGDGEGGGGHGGQPRRMT